MMKMNFKLNLFAALIILVLPVFVFAAKTQKRANDPSSNSAAISTTTPEKKKAQIKTALCEKAGELYLKIGQRIENNRLEIQDKRKSRLDNIVERAKERDQKLEELRAKWDQNRNQQFVKLAERAQT